MVRTSIVHQSRRVLTLTAGLLLVAAAPARAQDFTVQPGETLGPQVMSGAGDAGVIEAGGTVAGGGTTAIFMENVEQSAINGGAVTTTGLGAVGIYSIGDKVEIENSGTITTTGPVGHAILASGAEARISNSGAIFTSGPNAAGLFVDGANAYVEHTGTITTTASSSDGIRSFADNSWIVSSGSITTAGFEALGILSDHANARIENSGTIVTTGQRGYGISGEGDNAEISNSGGISTAAVWTAGIRSIGDNAKIDNSGTIATTGNSSDGIVSVGDNAEITNSELIDTDGVAAAGVRSLGDNAKIDNSGLISTIGDASDGIASSGANAVIGNSGVIVATGSMARGIYATGVEADITNSGGIATSNLMSHGIYATGAGAEIENSGSIATTGVLSSGIYTEGAGTSIVTSGTIATSGIQSFGIHTQGPNSRIVNSGTIATTGLQANGIVISGADTRLENSGTIQVSGPSAMGILASGAAQVTNAGTISSQQSNAIVFFGAADNVLTLKQGSVVEGGILLGGGTDTLVVGPGVSIVYTFDKAPEVLNAGGAPVVVAGTQVAVVDVTTLAGEDEALADLTGGIAQTVQSRLAGLRSHDGVARQREYWVQGFGSRRDQAGEGAASDSDQHLAGLVSGLDAPISAATRAGLFLGGAWGEIASSLDTQKTSIDSFYGGIYASTVVGSTAFDFVLSGGHSDYDRNRTVGNNLADGGIERATAGYDGYFVSPELTITQPVVPFGVRLDQILTLRYAGLFLDGFSESGAADGFAMEDRDIHLGVARAALALPIESRSADGGYGRLTLTGGIEGRTQFGDSDVSGTLLGQAIVFDPSGDDDAVAGFAGLTGEHTTPDGFTAFITLEGKVEDDGSHLVSTYGGVRWQF